MFPELNSLSIADLNKLDSSVDRLDEFLETTAPVRELNRMREDWITRIQEIASK